MDRITGIVFALVVAVLFAAPHAGSAQDQQPVGFFVTSAGPGDGANLGGLDGADQHCQNLAATAGAGDRTWRAYLSQSAGFGGPESINARDRIGPGPWYNANGQMVAGNVADLHGDFEHDRNNIRKPSAVDENGDPVNGRRRSAEPARHPDRLGFTRSGADGSQAAGDNVQQLDQQQRR